MEHPIDTRGYVQSENPITVPNDVSTPPITANLDTHYNSPLPSDAHSATYPITDARGTLKCVYMNINGLGDKLTIEDNVKCLNSNDIIVISESWITKDTDPKKYHIAGFTNPVNVYRKNLHDRARRPSGGMIIYIRDAYQEHINVIDTICDHFAILEIQGMFNFPVFLIICYVPPEDTTFICKSCDNNYLGMLRDLVIRFSSKGTVAVCGDLNAHTALLDDNLSSCNGITDPSDMVDSAPWSQPLPKRASCDSRVNNFGKELISLCDISGLRIMNGRCSLDNGIGKPTYIKGDTRSVIDYLLVQEKLYPQIAEFSIGEKWPDSDHCPVNFCFNLTMSAATDSHVPGCEPDNASRYTRFYWDDEQSDEFINCLLDETGCEHLDRFYYSVIGLESPQVVCEMFNDYIVQACERSLRKSKSNCRTSKFPANPWFDEDCKSAKAMYHDADRANASSDTLTRLAREYKRIRQSKKRKYFKDNLLDIESCTNPKELWAKLKDLKGKNETFDTQELNLKSFYEHFSKPAIDNTANCLNFDLSHEAECQDFFNRFAYGNGSGSDGSAEDDLISHLMNDNITLGEVTKAIKVLKKGKSPGVDGIPVDIFKNSLAELSENLVILFNYILGSGEYPESWAEGIISPVPKTVAPKEVDKFRKVTVLPAISKIFDTIINNRLEFTDHVFQQYDVFNGGFKKGSMCSDNLFVLNAIIEKYKCLNKPLYVCFVDFKRAFDCVNRMLMFTKLIKGTGECSRVLKIMISMYKKTTCSVKWKGFLSEKFLDTMGVAQGGVTSPYFFKKFLSDLVENLDNDCGIIIHDFIIKHLLWADDLFLVSSSATGMQKQLNNLDKYCSQWQLVVNTLKTKILVFGMRSISTVFTFHGNTIETSSDYSYLGNCVKNSRNPFTKIEDVILHKCYKACYKIREYTESLGQLTPTMAIHFFNTLIAPILDYGSEIWYSESVASKLEIFQKKFFKRNLAVRETTPDLAVFGELGIYPVSLRLKTNVLKYLHRIEQMPIDSPVKWAYLELRSLHTAGYDTWLSKAMDVFTEYQSISNISFQTFIELSRHSMKFKVKKCLHQHFETTWLSDINDQEKCPKLRTYCKFKSNFQMEIYLSLHEKTQRVAISKFRMSSHHLAIEIGRHSRPKIPKENRLCSNCKEIQDELHHLLSCSLLSDLRKPLLRSAIHAIPSFNSLTLQQQFVEIMGSPSKNLMKAIATFLIKADDLLRGPLRHTP